MSETDRRANSQRGVPERAGKASPSQAGTPAKVRKATALAYEPGADKAPKIIATGRGDIAEKIIETAREADVPVYEDAHLADVLGTLKLGTEIPQELYEVVAEVLAFVSRMDEQAMTRRRTSLAERMGATPSPKGQGQR